jgi:hypothetical protein
MNSPKPGRGPSVLLRGHFRSCGPTLCVLAVERGTSTDRSSWAARLSSAIGALLLGSARTWRFAGGCSATDTSLDEGFRRGRPGLSRSERSASFKEACWFASLAAKSTTGAFLVSPSRASSIEISSEGGTVSLNDEAGGSEASTASGGISASEGNCETGIGASVDKSGVVPCCDDGSADKSGEVAVACCDVLCGDGAEVKGALPRDS